MRELRKIDLDPSTVELLVCGDDAATHAADESCAADLGPRSFTRRQMRVVDDAGAPVLGDDARPMKVAESHTSLLSEARMRLLLETQQRALERTRTEAVRALLLTPDAQIERGK